MDNNKIKYLRQNIISSISECKKALEKNNGDEERALEDLRKIKTKEIIDYTGTTLSNALLLYQQSNGDTKKAISIYKFKRMLENIDSPKIVTEIKSMIDCEYFNDKSKMCFNRMNIESDQEILLTIMMYIQNRLETININLLKNIISIVIRDEEFMRSKENFVLSILEKILLYDSDEFKSNIIFRKFIIETLLGTLNFYSYSIDGFDLLTEYLELVSNDLSNSDPCDVANALNGLKYYDIYVEDTIPYLNNIIKDENFKMDIIYNLNLGDSIIESIKDKYEIIKKVNDRIKLKRRVSLISNFIFVVNPLCRENQLFLTLEFVHYYDANYASYNNWQFGRNHKDRGFYISAEKLVSEGIISKHEKRLFEKLGKMIDENVNNKKIDELYKALLQGKDLITVIFTLPEN